MNTGFNDVSKNGSNVEFGYASPIITIHNIDIPFDIIVVLQRISYSVH